MEKKVTTPKPVPHPPEKMIKEDPEGAKLRFVYVSGKDPKVVKLELGQKSDQK